MFQALIETLNLFPSTGVPDTDGLEPEGATTSETTEGDGDALIEGDGDALVEGDGDALIEGDGSIVAY